ncbi:hypothetical protein Droror1_Dr00019963 [Drosera rotundifolia]
MDQGLSLYRTRVQSDGKSRQLSEEQAVQFSKKVVVCFLATLGFEGVTEVPLEVLSQIFSCHISKLGKTLKILADSYKKQCSATELLRMFLHTLGYRSDPLKELLADAKTKSNKLEVESKGQNTAPSDSISCRSCLDCPCPKGL